MLAPAVPGNTDTVIEGDIPSLAAALGRKLTTLVHARSVTRPRGTRGFSFHWSNAQARWDVIVANDPTWTLDGAEFLVYVRVDALSPLGKPWSLKEMQYVAAKLPPHPGASGAAEGRYGSMSTLRSKLIRLAHENPGLRPHLLPLLADGKTAGDVVPFTGKWQGKNPPPGAVSPQPMAPEQDLPTGKTVEFPKSQIRAHRYQNSLQVVDTTNAGKRGKKVDSFTLYDIPSKMTMEVATAYSTLLDAILHGQVPFATLLPVAKTVADMGEHDMLAPKLQMTAQRGVDVRPAGFETLSIHGHFVAVEAGYNDFVVRDTMDRNNETTCIPAMKGGKKDIPVFYRWVLDNQSKLQGGMRFNEVLEAMRSLGVKYHQYCAMD